jgi:hypothetical protein
MIPTQEQAQQAAESLGDGHEEVQNFLERVAEGEVRETLITDIDAVRAAKTAQRRAQGSADLALMALLKAKTRRLGRVARADLVTARQHIEHSIKQVDLADEMW